MVEQTVQAPPPITTPLRPLNRLVTTHDDSGTAIFSSEIPSSADFKEIGGGNTPAAFFLAYATDTYPTQLSNNADITRFQKFMKEPPGIIQPGGSVARVVDMAPGHLSPMHRTESLDYGVVIEGEIELILDSGEVRLMKRGDISVQRGTMHRWRNCSETEWARMLYILLEAAPIYVDGKRLGEDYGGIEGVKSSGH